jgi:serine/threonine protein kinase
MKSLIKLSKWLSNSSYFKEAIAVEKIQKDWEDAAREFGSKPISEEQYLKENISRPARTFLTANEARNIEILNQYGFQVLDAEGRSPFLGGGAFGKVYRGTYKGLPTVAKIITDFNISRHFRLRGQNLEAATNLIENEVDNWKKILAAKEHLPPHLKKHIPITYELIEEKIPTVLAEKQELNSDVQTIKIIIMEELSQLPEDLLARISGPFFVSSREGFQNKRIADLVTDPDFLYEASKTFVDILNKRISTYRDQTVLKYVPEIITPQAVHKIFLENISNLKEMVLGDTSFEIRNLIVKKIFQYLFLNLKYYINDIKKEDIETELGYAIKHAIYNSFLPREVPYSADEGKYIAPHLKHEPEVKGLVELLLTLRDQFGIKWRDVRADNLMMGKDGNLKIIDVGLFV